MNDPAKPAGGGDRDGAGDGAGEPVRYAVADRVARITLNRPRTRNALSAEVIDGLLAALERAAADPGVRVIVLTGAGDRAFCAGGDLSAMGGGAGATGDGGGSRTGESGSRTEVPASGTGVPAARHSPAYRLFTAFPRLGKPVIGRLAGHALAGGLGLAASCDLVIAADDVKLGTPEVDVGLWPMMIMAILNRHVGPKQAFTLYYTGRPVSAARAVELGLVTAAVPRAELDARVDELAATIAAKSPVAIRMGRDAYYASQDRPLEDQIADLYERFTALAATEDAREGITAFLEKRPPKWVG